MTKRQENAKQAMANYFSGMDKIAAMGVPSAEQRQKYVANFCPVPTVINGRSDKSKTDENSSKR